MRKSSLYKSRKEHAWNCKIFILEVYSNMDQMVSMQLRGFLPVQKEILSMVWTLIQMLWVTYIRTTVLSLKDLYSICTRNSQAPLGMFMYHNIENLNSRKLDSRKRGSHLIQTFRHHL